MYEGEFKFDFRNGMGVKYTENYIDEGLFDKVILYGSRKFRNGNLYKGTFKNNKMHTIRDGSFNEKLEFLDVENNLLYTDEVIIEEDQLIKAKSVYRQDMKELLGCFVNG